MRRFVLMLAITVAWLFVSLWNTLQAQGTIEPKDGDQPTFSGGSTGGSAGAPGGPTAGKTTTMFAAVGEAPEGFIRMTSGAVMIKDITIQVQRSGYPEVDPDLTQIEKDFNDKVKQIIKDLNDIVETQVDPTLQLKKGDADTHEATKKMHEAVARQVKQAREEFDKLVTRSKQRVEAAYAKCPVRPLQGEPGICQSFKPGTLTSLDTAKELVMGRFDIWKEENDRAIDNPTGYDSPDAKINSGTTWDTATQELKNKIGEADGDTSDSGQKLGGNFDDVQAQGAPDAKK